MYGLNSPVKKDKDCETGDKKTFEYMLCTGDIFWCKNINSKSTDKGTPSKQQP